MQRSLLGNATGFSCWVSYVASSRMIVDLSVFGGSVGRPILVSVDEDEEEAVGVGCLDGGCLER